MKTASLVLAIVGSAGIFGPVAARLFEPAIVRVAAEAGTDVATTAICIAAAVGYLAGAAFAPRPANERAARKDRASVRRYQEVFIHE